MTRVLFIPDERVPFSSRSTDRFAQWRRNSFEGGVRSRHKAHEHNRAAKEGRLNTSFFAAEDHNSCPTTSRSTVDQFGPFCGRDTLVAGSGGLGAGTRSNARGEV